MPAPRILRSTGLRRLSLPLLAAALGVSLGLWMFRGQQTELAPSLTTPPPVAPLGESSAATPRNNGENDELLPSGLSDAATRAALAERLRARLNGAHLRPNEATLIFKDAAAYHRFLDRAQGLAVVDRIDSLLAVRLRVEDYPGFVDDLAAHFGDYLSVAPNPLIGAPTPPVEDRASRHAEPVGANLLAILGIEPGVDRSSWGRDVLVAVLDGGVGAEAAFGDRLTYRDIGYGERGSVDDGRHATAVAGLIGGASADAPGVAPAAGLLSIRVLDLDGRSDAFTVAKGIQAALESGAQVINISLGGYSTSPVLVAAIEEALAAGVAVVASAGNNQAASLVWPAAHAGVVSVGATDAAGTQAIFSNSGPGLQLTAPGYAISTVGPDGARIDFSGTSASAPVAAGAIAVLLSQTPGISPIQAADILANHANDGGRPGPDPDYGRGTLNLGWALDRNNPGRVDPALSSQSYDASTRTLLVVVQNRGARPVHGLSLRINLGGTITTHPLPTLGSAASASVRVPVDAARLSREGRIAVESRLVLPPGLVDTNLANNQITGAIVSR